jgi:hypothetical protein
MERAILRYARYIQPAGFALLLIHFILVRQDTYMSFLWAGVACTVLGTITEIYFFGKTPAAKRTQVSWVFGLGIVAKVLLIGAIVLRVYEYPFSMWILLACIVLSFIWVLLSQLVKPVKESNKDFLDVE